MNDSSQSGTSSRAGPIIGMVVAFIGGYALGNMTTPQRSAPAGSEIPAQAQRRSVPVGLSPTLGPADALVTIVEFSDFRCGYCSRHVAVRRRLMEDYDDRVRWVFKHFPLRGSDAAEASMAAHAQGRFWDYADKLFTNQRNLEQKDLIRYARELGLDLQKFQEALERKTYAEVVAADQEIGRALGVSGTPNLFINGRHFPGAIPHAKLEVVVRQELAHARTLLAQGVQQEDLYRQLTASDRTQQERGAGATKADEGGTRPQPAAGAAGAKAAGEGGTAR